MNTTPVRQPPKITIYLDREADRLRFRLECAKAGLKPAGAGRVLVHLVNTGNLDLEKLRILSLSLKAATPTLP